LDIHPIRQRDLLRSLRDGVSVGPFIPHGMIETADMMFRILLFVAGAYDREPHHGRRPQRPFRFADETSPGTYNLQLKTCGVKVSAFISMD
jgi:hypothetical protein